MKKEYFIFFSFIILITILSGVTAQTLTKNDLFTKLKDNNEKDKTAVFEFNNQYNLSVNKNDFGITFNEVCGNVISYDLLAWQLCEKSKRQIVDSKRECKYYEIITDNKTLDTEISEICNDIPIYDDVTYYEYDYCKFNQIPDGKTDLKITNVKIDWENCGNGWGYTIDWIPRVIYNNIEYVNIDWAWWNVSYDRRRNVTNIVNDDLLFYINGSGGFDGNNILVNPADCGGNISLYYQSTNTSDYKVICNDSVDITTPTTPADLVAFWELEDLTEYTGNHDLTTYEGSATANNSCLIGSCYTFDGDDSLNATLSGDFNFTANFTWLIWGEVGSSLSGDEFRRIISAGKFNADSQAGYNYGYGQHSGVSPGVDTQRFSTASDTGSGGQTDFFGDVDINEEYTAPSVWNLFVLTKNATTIMYFSNYTNVENGAFDYVYIANTNSFIIGSGLNSNEYFTGNLDNILIFNERMILINELENYYKNTKPIPENMLLQSEELSPENDAPTISDVTIYPANPQTNDTILNCSGLPLDDSTNLDVYFYWHKNDVLQDYNATISTTNNTITYTSVIVNETLTAGDNWTCYAKSYDSVNFSAPDSDTKQISLAPQDNITATNFNCEYNPKPNIKYLENIKWLCAINCTTLNCTTYKCYTYVKFMNDIIQINPKQTEIDQIGLIDYYTAEPQNENQQYVSVYFTATDLRNNEPLNFSVVCAGDDRILQFTKEITPKYKDLTDVPDRAVWIMDNTAYIIGGIFIFVLIGGILWILARGIN